MFINIEGARINTRYIFRYEVTKVNNVVIHFGNGDRAIHIKSDNPDDLISKLDAVCGVSNHE